MSRDEAAADTYVTEEFAVEAKGTAEEQEVDEKTTEEEAQSDKWLKQLVKMQA